jgi:putative FmdB family regulatory protein
MPTYEYVCRSCGTHVEVYQRFSDDPLTECGVCGGPLRKVFHPAGILFKGSGFYATDSRRASAGASGDGSGRADERSSAKEASSARSGTREPAAKAAGGTESSAAPRPGSKEKSA